MVTVLGYSKNTCVLCNRDTECFDADFGKLKGQFCRACFTKLVRVRSTRKEAARPTERSADVNGQAPLPK